MELNMAPKRFRGDVILLYSFRSTPNRTPKVGIRGTVLNLWNRSIGKFDMMPPSTKYAFSGTSPSNLARATHFFLASSPDGRSDAITGEKK